MPAVELRHGFWLLVRAAKIWHALTSRFRGTYNKRDVDLSPRRWFFHLLRLLFNALWRREATRLILRDCNEQSPPPEPLAGGFFVLCALTMQEPKHAEV